MNSTDGERVGAMPNPPHLGELIGESMDEVGWNVTETAARLECERGTPSRLLNGKAGVSANMVLALEALGWGTADHWMWMQASYELAQARRKRGWREDITVREAVPQ
ncbi:MAG: HigA family addiction module antitoxin [Bryobacterales bacterium]|nr:HigA family addiction module antitoxin [Bryobacterales bacterium]